MEIHPSIRWPLIHWLVLLPTDNSPEFELFLFWWLFLYALRRRKHACWRPSLFIWIGIISKSVSSGGVGCLYLESKSVPAVGVGCLSGNGYYALPLFARYPTCGNICTLWRVRAICGCLDDYTVFSSVLKNKSFWTRFGSNIGNINHE